MLEKVVGWDTMHNNSSRFLVRDLVFIEMYWAEYISKKHLLTQTLQAGSPGMTSVYALHADF